MHVGMVRMFAVASRSATHTWWEWVVMVRNPAGAGLRKRVQRRALVHAVLNLQLPDSPDSFVALVRAGQLTPSWHS